MGIRLEAKLVSRTHFHARSSELTSSKSHTSWRFNLQVLIRGFVLFTRALASTTVLTLHALRLFSEDAPTTVARREEAIAQQQCQDQMMTRYDSIRDFQVGKSRSPLAEQVIHHLQPIFSYRQRATCDKLAYYETGQGVRALLFACTTK